MFSVFFLSDSLLKSVFLAQQHEGYIIISSRGILQHQTNTILLEVVNSAFEYGSFLLPELTTGDWKGFFTSPHPVTARWLRA